MSPREDTREDRNVGDAKDSAGHAGQDGHKVIRLSMGVDRVDEEDSHRRSGSSSRSGPQPESDED